MAVAFTSENALGFITLDHPPANSYDLAFMTEYASAVDEAITRANDTPYGLGSSIWTHDARLIHRAAQEIESGMTWVNQIHYGYDELPFGGVKASGFGKEHGIEALDSYVEIKSVVVGGLS